MATEYVRRLTATLQGELDELKSDAARVQRAIDALRSTDEKVTKKRARHGKLKTVSPEMSARVLALLTRSAETVTSGDVAARLKIHPSSAANTLASLAREGKAEVIGKVGRTKMWALARPEAPGENGNGREGAPEDDDLLGALRANEQVPA